MIADTITDRMLWHVFGSIALGVLVGFVWVLVDLWLSYRQR